MIINKLRDEEFLKGEMDFIRVTMANTRQKVSYRSFVMAKANMSSKPSKPSHYDTLEVNRRSTHGEIKASYFKLSKQYHPDKNKSAAAIDKFRNITEAYEVLGNYKSRKIYDRSMLTRTEYPGRQEAGPPVDHKAQYYQAQRAIFKNRKAGSERLYDFDAWTKAHYKRTFQRTMEEKDYGEFKRRLKVDNEYKLDHEKEGGIVLAVFSVLFVVGLAWLGIRNPSYSDSTFLTNQIEKKLEQPESSDIKPQREDC